MIKPLLTAVLVLIPATVQAACLTKAQAKHKWPRTHLYWHTEDRCWDNKRRWSRSAVRYAAHRIEEEEVIIPKRQIKILSVVPDPRLVLPELEFEQRWPEELK